MNRAARLTIVYIIVGLAGWSFLRMINKGQGGSDQPIDPNDPNIIFTLGKLPTIPAMQLYLGVNPDGKLGPCWRESETQAAWDAVICNQEAAKYNHIFKAGKR
jgi:hypothetical protein